MSDVTIRESLLDALEETEAECSCNVNFTGGQQILGSLTVHAKIEYCPRCALMRDNSDEIIRLARLGLAAEQKHKCVK